MTRIFCDSSTHEACFVIEGQEPVITPYDEKVTVNVGEYRAVILALREARRRNLLRVTLLTDSLLVVNQVNGTWKCRKKHLLPYRARVRAIISYCDYKLEWIPREENLAGLVLE